MIGYRRNGIYLHWNISHKKNEVLLFETDWMDLEDFMLSEVSQRETNHINLKNKNLKDKINEQIKQNLKNKI